MRWSCIASVWPIIFNKIRHQGSHRQSPLKPNHRYQTRVVYRSTHSSPNTHLFSSSITRINTHKALQDRNRFYPIVASQWTPLCPFQYSNFNRNKIEWVNERDRVWKRWLIATIIHRVCTETVMHAHRTESFTHDRSSEFKEKLWGQQSSQNKKHKRELIILWKNT